MSEYGEHHRHHHGGERCQGEHGEFREHPHHHYHGGEERCGEHGGPPMHHRHVACRCGCGEWGPGPVFRRRFQTREEKIARLEDYLKGLQAEAKAVEERLAELKG